MNDKRAKLPHADPRVPELMDFHRGASVEINTVWLAIVPALIFENSRIDGFLILFVTSSKLFDSLMTIVSFLFINGNEVVSNRFLGKISATLFLMPT